MSNSRYRPVPHSDGQLGRPVERPGYSNQDKMSSSSQGTTMKVMNSPGTDCALTNCAYVSPSDLPRFVLRQGLSSGLGLVGNSMQGDVLDKYQQRVKSSNLVQSASMLFIAEMSRFVPPERGFNLVLLTVELEFVKFRGKPEQLDAQILAKELQKRFAGQVLTVGQKVTFEYVGTNYTFCVNQTLLEGNSGNDDSTRGILTSETHFMFETPGNSGIKMLNQSGGSSTNLFKSKDFNFQKLGIGGLDNEFQDIFRRAFASRVFPPHVISKLGIPHVKGMLLWGPPGTGKTLIARQIGKMLNGREPKIVNGPEILSKFVGETEKNVRDLFADAEKDQREHGDGSELHIIIFDEIDAICKARGSTRDGTGVHDSIVNQLLTKIDGVESLNNILLIGMTNRKDMLDEALLRPGRLEVQIEIGLPDEKGRVQILNIHSNKMKQNSFLSENVNLEELAARTKNFSGAELEGLVKSAVSFALNRQVNFDDLNQSLDEDNIKVTMDDFLHALQEVKPAFGAAISSLEMCRLNGMLDCGPRHKRIQETGMALTEQVKTSERTPLLSCLIEGPSGSGKTALAATIAIDSDFPFIKIVSAESMVGLTESTKCGIIGKIFEDAYKSPLSIIILDDIERIIEFVNIGPRFSNLILQTLLVLIKRVPPKGRKLLVIGTTSMRSVMESMDVVSAFNVAVHVPMLNHEDIKKVLAGLNVFAPRDVDSALAVLDEEMPIKKLLTLVEMSAQGKSGEGAEAVYAGKEKIDISRFVDCYNDLAS
ncbi:hypothetical protein AXG93_1112s1390 [Marchantia polymorpha subsp. ruderalis]|uniref:Vesicle-fusing ATPase n=1 Tax=Marchantia polymorpha subsp. ruderalis TaxID=1480154 RepID=A0A176WBW2_MARPO|nr:hypothetical protein AXG93_1112s1390 [Marchantia polymorpha subsp. ruderalis]